jgi:hypothetical protein
MDFDEDIFDIQQWTIRKISLRHDVIHKKDKIILELLLCMGLLMRT